MTTPTFSSGWDFVMGLGKAHLPANLEVATFSRCRNSTGEPQILGRSLAQSHAHFFSGCNFMMGLGKPKLHTKFEVAIFSRCKNIKGKLQNFGELPEPMDTPTFLLV